MGAQKVYFAHEILEQIERRGLSTNPGGRLRPRHAAMDFVYTDGGGKVGMIASVSGPSVSAATAFG